MDADRSFAFKIATIVAIGFCVSVAGATYVDARIPSHFQYGAREYRYGYWIALLAVPLFVCTLIALSRTRTRGWKCMAACGPLIYTVVGSQWAFAPEIPHQGITLNCGMYAITVLLATWLRYTTIDIEYLTDKEVPISVRLEGLKSVITLWQGLALATAGGFLALLVPWPVAVINANTYVASAKADLFLLNSLAMLQIGLISVSFIVAPIREAVVVVMRLTRTFRELR
jgi:hypothetical protein